MTPMKVYIFSIKMSTCQNWQKGHKKTPEKGVTPGKGEIGGT
jgi:hypothetical protein